MSFCCCLAPNTLCSGVRSSKFWDRISTCISNLTIVLQMTSQFSIIWRQHCLHHGGITNTGPTLTSRSRAAPRLFGKARAERDGTRAETRFRLSPKRTSPLKSVGASVQSTAGSRGVRIRLSNVGYTTFGGGVRVLATHSIRQFPLHFPSRASPCATRFRTSSTSTLTPGVKPMRRKATYLDTVKNECSYTPTPRYTFMTCKGTNVFIRPLST